jgi:ubiquinone/menaquinone biosynthesis C-methylase UbiE
VLRRLITAAIAAPLVVWVLRQCRRPSGPLGRALARAMNVGHASMTDWALGHVNVPTTATVLDVGCGGGRTMQTLARLAPHGTVHGIDYSPASVAAAERTNAAGIAGGRVHVRLGSVSSLPFADATFDLVTAIETHYYWPDLAANFREVLRVLKPGGKFLLVAETSREGVRGALYAPVMALIGAKHFTRAALMDLLAAAGFTAVAADRHEPAGWICVAACRP